MKRFFSILLILATSVAFAQRVNVDGTVSDDFEWSQSNDRGASAPATGVNLMTGEFLAMGVAAVAMAVGVGIALSNNDPVRGNGHLTHASQRTQ